MTSIKLLVIVGVRLFALWIGFNAAVTLPNQIGMYLSSGEGNWFTKVATLSGIIYGFVYLAAGAAMWKYSVKIADVVMKGLPENSQFDSEMSFENNYKVAASVLGLFILSSAVPSAIILVVSYLFPESNPKYIKTFDLHGTKVAEIPAVDYLTVALRLGIGAWLFLGSESFSKVLKGIWGKDKIIGT